MNIAKLTDRDHCKQLSASNGKMVIHGLIVVISRKNKFQGLLNADRPSVQIIFSPAYVINRLTQNLMSVLNTVVGSTDAFC